MRTEEEVKTAMIAQRHGNIKRTQSQDQVLFELQGLKGCDSFNISFIVLSLFNDTAEWSSWFDLNEHLQSESLRTHVYTTAICDIPKNPIHKGFTVL